MPWTPLKLGRYAAPAGRTLVMGVLNVTHDSFSDGGLFLDAGRAIEHAHQLVAEGADVLDIGGESTRPGAEPVPAGEELRRVLPVVEAVVSQLDVPISIDTMKPEVADACLSAGAVMLNDVRGLRDPVMIETAARHGAGVVIMHMKGTPRTMNEEAVYDDVVAEVRAFLAEQAARARSAGIATVVIDPGLGFAKSTGHSLSLLRHLGVLTSLGYPVLVGASRKRFIGELTGRPAGDRVAGTVAATTAAVLGGAAIVRVHDVAEATQAVRVAEAIRGA